jgi:hypothetical protein
MRIFEKKLRDLQLRQNLIIILRYVLIALTIFILSFDLFFIVQLLSANHLNKLYIFSISQKIFLFLVFFYLLWQAIRSSRSKLQTAKQLDEYNLDKTDTYQNALELQAEEIDPAILSRIQDRADRMAEHQIIKSDKSILSPIWKLFLIFYLSSAALFILNPQKFIAARDFFVLWEKPAIKHKDFVEVLPGNISVTRNSKVTIEVLNPEPDVEHKLFYMRELNWREESMPSWRRDFDNLDFSFSYYIKTPYAISDTFRVEVFELPIVTNIDVRLEFPGYTGMKNETLRNTTGNIRAIAGTRIFLNVQVNNPLHEMKIVFSDGRFKNMDRTGIKSFQTDFILEQSGSYHFSLIDVLGNTSKQLKKMLVALADEYPQIEITIPGKDTLLTQNMLLPLQFVASDDFGLADLQLFYQLNQNAADSLSILKKIAQFSINHNFIFNLSDLSLLPGDRITYWAQISDNSPARKTSQSKRFLARFPSIEEIYREIETQEQQKKEVLENTLQKSRELQEEFEEKRRELLKKQELDWEDKKDLENILNQQENLNKDVQQIAQDFQNLMNKFEDNQALSQETLDKMARIQELMEDIASEELQKAMDKLRDSLNDLDPDVLKKALEDFKFSLEDFSRKLDQTIKLLEDIKKEQAIQKALEIAEEMAEMQSSLNEKTKDKEIPDQQLQNEQQQIGERLESLEQQLEELARMMDEKDSELKKLLEELQENIKNSEISKDIQQSGENLQQGNRQQAQESQSSIQEKIDQMIKMLQVMKEKMSAGAQLNIMEALQTAIRKLMIFSQRHLDSQKRYSGDPYQILHDQIAIFEGINLTITELMQIPMIVLALGPKFFYDMNFTTSTYYEMFQYINDALNSKVPSYLSDIQKGINLMIFDLMQSSQNMQDGGSSGGMQSLMQSLQDMGQQQMMINMISKQLLQQMNNEGRMNQEMMSQAQRLARDEQRLAENLKRILQNDREAQKQTSALNQIIEDLEAISHDLKRGRIDQNLISKQEKILSRLLDAQRSIHKREFSQQRKGETRETDDWQMPENLKLEFEKMLRKAILDENMNEFPKEYQELIREYLKILNEKAGQAK